MWTSPRIRTSQQYDGVRLAVTDSARRVGIFQRAHQKIREHSRRAQIQPGDRHRQAAHCRAGTMQQQYQQASSANRIA